MAVGPTTEAIRTFINEAEEGGGGRLHSAYKWLALCAPDEVAYLTARVVLNEAAIGSTLQRAAMNLAKAIIDHVEMRIFRDKNPAGYRGLQSKNRFIRRQSRNRMNAIRKLLESEEAKLEISSGERLLLGTKAIELFIEATGLFVVDRRPMKSRKGDWAYHIVPTEAVEKWLTEQHARCALLDPLLMPMIVRPKRWRNPRRGGYLTPLAGRWFVRNGNAQYQRRLREADLTLVYDAVNFIQEVPWRINRRVLDVMTEAWDSGALIADLPRREDRPLPEFPQGGDEEKERAWKRDAVAIHAENASLLSSRFAVQRRLWLATRFAEEPAIWFPHSLDFRGRVYPILNGLQPLSMGTEVSADVGT